MIKYQTATDELKVKKYIERRKAQMQQIMVSYEARELTLFMMSSLKEEEFRLLENAESVMGILQMSIRMIESTQKTEGVEKFLPYINVLKEESRLKAVAEQIAMYAKFEREEWEKLTEQMADQPAGTPERINHPSLSLVMAKRYLKGNRQAKKTRKLAQHKVKDKRQRYIDSVKGEFHKKHPDCLCEPTEEMFERFIFGDVNKISPWMIRREWYSPRIGRIVYIVQNFFTGKCKLTTAANFKETSFKLRLYVNTYGASKVYKMEAEARALECLKSKVSQRDFDRYLITGMLFERSKRTGLVYIFRRLRPTIVFRECIDENGRDYERFVAALCGHPQGYYGMSWAGTMVPTDDVVAHLVMMRSDERKYWKSCTQHEERSPQADI